MQRSQSTTSSTDVYVPTFVLDEQGHRVGTPVDDRIVERPESREMMGTYVRLEPLDAQRHSADLWAAYQGHDDLWTYMPQGPFGSLDEYRAWVERVEHRDDPMFFAIVDIVSDKAQGVASYLRIDPGSRSIEVGWITYAPVLQGTRGATDAMYLMMRDAFDRGYRRYEWKCNALNDASMRAARRLGMTYEGTFRQSTVVKGRNRDTAWFSLLDAEWPDTRSAMERWLLPGNFDESGHQIAPLGLIRG